MKAITTLALLALGSAPALAEDAALVTTAAPRNTLAVDALAVLPVGDYAHVADFGAGAALRLEVPRGAGFITGRAGIVLHASNMSANITVAPVYAGYRYPLGGSVYVAGELGLSLVHASVQTQYGSGSDSDVRLGFSLMAGTRRGALDLRAGLFSPDADDAVGLMASAGYEFAAF